MLIGKLSDYLFIQINKIDNLEGRVRYQFREAIIKNIDFDIMKKMIDDSSLKIAQGMTIDLILNRKERNTPAGLLILSHYFFDKEMRKNLDYDINNLEKQIRGIKDKNQKKIAKIAIQNLRKNFYIVTKKDNVKSNLFKLSVSIASTLCFHFLTHMHQSGVQFNLNECRGILALICISLIFLSLGLFCDMIAGDVLKGKSGLFEARNELLDNLKKDQELWKKICDYKIDGEEHKIRCGCESGGMSLEKNKNPDEKTLNERDLAEPCECCCISRILRLILRNDRTLSEEQKFEIKIFLYSKELEKEIEKKEMNNGGACPCSNLAKADKKTVHDKLNEFKIDAILWQEKEFA